MQREEGPSSSNSNSGLDLGFLQPWVLCSCGSSLCECPLHASSSRVSSPPPLPTVTEDEAQPLRGLPPRSPATPRGRTPRPASGAYPSLEATPRLPAEVPTAGRAASEGLLAGGAVEVPTTTLRGAAAESRAIRHGSLPREAHAQQLQHSEAGEAAEKEEAWDHFQSTVCAGLRQALAHTERDFFRMVEQEVEERPDLTMVGSCVLALLIHSQHLFTLCLGDSRAVLATWNPDAGGAEAAEGAPAPGLNCVTVKGVSIGTSGSRSDSAACSSGGNGAETRGQKCLQGERRATAAVEIGRGAKASLGGRSGEGQEGSGRAWVDGLRAVQLTEVHCVDHDAERQRVMSEHPDDPSAVVGSRVKGKLRVTRAFGAGYLKSEKMNNSLMGIFRVRDLWSPPYVSSKPHVMAHRLSPLDHFVVIGSDGLFDFFSNEEVVQHVAQFLAVSPHGDPAKYMLEQLLLRAADRAGKTLDELKSIPRGKRRKYHDDTTVIVITLGHTFRTSSASTLL